MLVCLFVVVGVCLLKCVKVGDRLQMLLKPLVLQPPPASDKETDLPRHTLKPKHTLTAARQRLSVYFDKYVTAPISNCRLMQLWGGVLMSCCGLMCRCVGWLVGSWRLGCWVHSVGLLVLLFPLQASLLSMCCAALCYAVVLTLIVSV